MNSVVAERLRLGRPSVGEVREAPELEGDAGRDDPEPEAG